MGVRINSTGNYQAMCSIDRLVERTGNLLQILTYEHHRSTIDKDVGRIGINGSNNLSVSNEGFHRGKLYDIMTPEDKGRTVWPLVCKHVRHLTTSRLRGDENRTRR